MTTHPNGSTTREVSINTQNLSQNLWRHAIGFDQIFNSLGANNGNFPPHNIEKITEDEYVLTLAVAGFKRENLSVTLCKDMLSITGTYLPPGSLGHQSPPTHYLYRGIALRDFEREFRVGQHVKITGATLEDGLLSVTLVRIVPEDEQTKTIEIR